MGLTVACIMGGKRAGGSVPAGPTPALIRLALEVSTTGALGAQAQEFERKAQLAGRRDVANFPARYSKAYMHFGLVNCLARTL